MPTRATLDGLLKRGLDTNTATRLVVDGYRIQDLQNKTVEELVVLGIPMDQAESLSDGRPPIPEETFLKVLHESKFVCCVCRDKNLGIIIHHLERWSKSKSHDFDNLVVLCLLHHDQAHTSKELTLMLPPERIRKLRDLWYQQVRSVDAAVIRPEVDVQGMAQQILGKTQEVGTAEELLLAIRSDSIIKLKKGKYNLSDYAKLKGNKAITWHPVFNGYEPHIHGIENLKLIGVEGTEIVIDPSYTWVLKFIACKQISMEGITLGHTAPGYCSGGVLMFESCTGITIKECDLYGCGTYGIEARDCSDLTVHKSKIRDCTYGIAEIFNTKSVLFRDCQMFNCREFSLLTIKDECEDINFLRCLFEGNAVLSDRHYFVYTDSTCKKVVIEYSQFHNNNVEKWVNIDEVVVTRHNEYKRNKFTPPTDIWWYD